MMSSDIMSFIKFLWYSLAAQGTTKARRFYSTLDDLQYPTQIFVLCTCQHCRVYNYFQELRENCIMSTNEHSYFSEAVDDSFDGSECEISYQLSQEQDKDLLLISMVKGYPHLYDRRMKEFRDADMKEKSWKKIGILMHMKPDDCQTRWLRLRERFTRELKLMDFETRKGAPQSSRRMWQYMPDMAFLESHIWKRKSYRTLSENMDNSQSESQSQEAVSHAHIENVAEDEVFTQRQKKPKFNRYVVEGPFLKVANGVTTGRGKEPDEDDDDAVFGKLVASELRKFEVGKSKSQLRIKILQLINDFE